MMKQYDLVVLGGGPGGYVAAIRAAQLGLKTAIVEQEHLGGICLNWGCIPTKALLKNAEVLHYVKRAQDYGISIPDYSVDFTATIHRSREVAERLSKGVQYLMKKNGIDHVQGRGRLESLSTIKVEGQTEDVLIEARIIILATGGRPKLYPGMEVDGVRVLTAREAMVLPQPPKKLAIIGAGAIGVEFAYFFHEFGSQVQLLEMLPTILPVEDQDAAREVTRSFKKMGIGIKTEAKVERMEILKTKVKVYVQRKGKEELVAADRVLVATGITGNVEDLGLEKLGIRTHKGFIEINDYCQTSQEHIYAIGDVAGPPWLAHVASAQGHVAVEHAAGKTVYPLDYFTIPACTYCQPQVASVGYTEQQAKDSGFDLAIGRFDFRANGRALASGAPTGFVKLIFDRKYGELLGAHIVGSEATELIAELALAKSLEATYEDLARMVHAHPTLSEAVMEAALDAFGESIHK